MTLSAIARSPRTPFVATGLVACGLVVGGLVLARTLNLAACHLCILQRMLYMLLTLEAVLTLALVKPALGRCALAVLMAATAATGVVVAGYQVWIQRFAKSISCTADQPWWERFVEWAGAQAPRLFEASGLCAEAGWTFLGLSIADWSLLAFSAITLGMLYAAVRAGCESRR